MAKTKIAVFGGDSRQTYAAQALMRVGYPLVLCGTPRVRGVCCFVDKAPSIESAMSGADIALFPTPFLREEREVNRQMLDVKMGLEDLYREMPAGKTIFAGGINRHVRARLESNNCTVIDLLQDERFARQNAELSAEGAITDAILQGKAAISGTKCLVLGYGRCGRAIAGKLKALGARVAVAARRQESRDAAAADGLTALSLEAMNAYLVGSQYIFNTIPSMVLDESRLRICNREASILDVASKPGGVDFTKAQEFRIQAKLCQSLPGVFVPKTAGQLIGDTVNRLLILRQREQITAERTARELQEV
ncbi:MAG: hypothetical protein LBR73_09645 [Oscillospiraceae bacterium]|jgi:dipicolinate synthase subunit A|nr:hypothetical protein [Oscillospiraceae bacterium]